MPFGIMSNHQRKVSDIYPKYRPYDPNIESCVYYSPANTAFSTSSVYFLEPPHMPNQAKLSVFIYYINYKPVKIPKVMGYFERQVEKDISRNNFNGVLVALEICKAMIQRSEHNFGLFHEAVLKIVYVTSQTQILEVVRGSLEAFSSYCRTGRKTDHLFRSRLRGAQTGCNPEVVTWYYSLVKTANEFVLGTMVPPSVYEASARVGYGAISEALLMDNGPYTSDVIAAYLSDRCLDVLLRCDLGAVEMQKQEMGALIFESLVRRCGDEIKLQVLVRYLLGFMDVFLYKYCQNLQARDPPMLWRLVIDNFPRKYLHVLFNGLLDYSCAKPEPGGSEIRSIGGDSNLKVFSGIVYRLIGAMYRIIDSDEVVISLPKVLKKTFADAASYFHYFEQREGWVQRSEPDIELDRLMGLFFDDPHFQLLVSLFAAIVDNGVVTRLDMRPRVYAYLVSLTHKMGEKTPLCSSSVHSLVTGLGVSLRSVMWDRDGGLDIRANHMTVKSLNDLGSVAQVPLVDHRPLSQTHVLKYLVTYIVYSGEVAKGGLFVDSRVQKIGSHVAGFLIEGVVGPNQMLRNLSTLLLIHLLGL